MPPASKKDCGLILFDVASSRKSELLNGLLKFATFKSFLNSRSLYRLILVNSASTQNDKDYPGIFTTEMDDLDPRLVFNAIESAQPGRSNWIDALQLGIHHLKEAVDMRGIVTLQLIYFTSLDASNTQPYNEASIKNVIDSLNAHGIFLYFIGPNVNLPFVITNANSVSKCMKELQVNQNDTNLVLARRLVTSTNNSLMCPTKIGVPHLLISFKNSQGSQPWKAPIAFGTKFSIPAITTKIYRKDISLKLFSPITQTLTKTLADNRDMLVDDANIVKGLIRHGKFLKMDDTQFKIETKSGFDILGFTDKKFIPETYIRGEETFYVLPNEATEDGFQIFTHLVKVMHDSGKYAIAKRIYYNNNKARFFVLIPNMNFKPKCFVMAGLPYAGFLTPHKCITPVQPKEKVRDDFLRFFKSITIENKGSNSGMALGPIMMTDVYQQKLTDGITKKYLKDDNLDLGSLNIYDYETTTNNKVLESLKNSWPVRTLETSPTKQKRN